MSYGLADAAVQLYLSWRDERFVTLSMQRAGQSMGGPKMGACPTCDAKVAPQWIESRKRGDRWACPSCHADWPIAGHAVRGTRVRSRAVDPMIEGVSSLWELGKPLMQVPTWPRRVLIGHAQLVRFEGGLRNVGSDSRQQRYSLGELRMLLRRLPLWERKLLRVCATVLAERDLRKVEVLAIAFGRVFPRRTEEWTVYRVRMDLRDGRRGYEQQLAEAGVMERWGGRAEGG